jgi:aminoglycoside 6'-N-acetyltransferase I
MSIEIKVLGPGDGALAARVANGVFDDPIAPDALETFLNDPRHHIVVARDGDLVVGFVSSVLYVHPDKADPELWVNEVGVAEAWRGRGVAGAMMRAMLDLARRCGAREAWVLTERANAPAMALYAGVGGREAPTDAVMFTFDL